MRHVFPLLCRAAVLAACLIPVLLASAAAFENEPTGYGDLSWGDPMGGDFIVSQNYEGCPECPMSDATRQGEAPVFQGLAFDAVYYSFTSQGLFSVTFRGAYDEAAFVQAAQVLAGLYGQPDFVSDEHLYWGDDNSLSVVALDRLDQLMVLSLQSNAP